MMHPTKTKKSWTMGIIIVLLMSLSGCFLFDGDDLLAPSGLSIQERTVSWESVTDASSYEYVINGTTYETETTIVVISDEIYGPVEFKVRAKNKEKTSDFVSQTFMLYKQLGVPTGLTYDNGKFDWNDVLLSSGYEITINGMLVAVTQSEYAYVLEGVVTVLVKAKGNEALGLLDSADSTLFVTGTDLDIPTGLTVSNGILRFDGVDDAVSYHIYVNGILHTTITDLEWQIPASVTSDPHALIRIRAIAEDGSISPLSLEIPANLYVISTADDLKALNAYGVVVLENDIVLEEPWTPVPFYGTMDGQGHTISGIDIEPNGENTGFFTVLAGATINDLTLTGTISGVAENSGSSVGGLAGRAMDVTITDVDVTIDIDISSANGTGFLGGVFGTLVSGLIENLAWNGSITAMHMTTGGFAGTIIPGEFPLEVTSSKATGTITSGGGEQSALGGFVGIMNKNNAVLHVVMADVVLQGTTYVGGFVGIMGSGVIHDAYAKGTLHATSLFLVHAGGFVGRLEGYNSDIATSIAAVDVTALLATDQAYLGAFAGHTVGGTYNTVYDHCYYDLLSSSLDRIGNPSTGRGDGINAFNASVPDLLAGFDGSIWTFENGPSLKVFA